jgi:hypothetical protein
MLKAMMAELVEQTQSDIPGEIFAYAAIFPDQEHDHINPFLAYKAVAIRPRYALLPSSHEGT